MTVYKRWIQGYTDKSAVHLSDSCPQVYWYVNLSKFIINLQFITGKHGCIQKIILFVWLCTAQYWRWQEHSSNNAETNGLHSNNLTDVVKAANFHQKMLKYTILWHTKNCSTRNELFSPSMHKYSILITQHYQFKLCETSKQL